MISPWWVVSMVTTGAGAGSGVDSTFFDLWPQALVPMIKMAVRQEINEKFFFI